MYFLGMKNVLYLMLVIESIFVVIYYYETIFGFIGANPQGGSAEE